MLRGRSRRLARLYAHANYAEIEEERRRHQAEARQALLDCVRYSLTQLGIDPMTVRSIQRLEADMAEEAAAPPPRAASEPEDPLDEFWAEIDRLAGRYLARPAINFDSASLMDVLAWCVAQQALRNGADPGAGSAPDFAADSLQEQQKSQ